MGERQRSERLQSLYDAGIKPYSISKLNAIDGCLREAYYTYKLHNRGRQSIYGIMGGKIHDVLEDIYNDRATKEDLLPALQRELDDAELIGVDFPRDFRGNNSIKENWVASITDFCNNFEKIPGDNFITEQEVIYKVSDRRYMVGYIDLISVIDEVEKTIEIYDFKTSTQFSKKDLLHHGRQLVLYAMAKEQEGYTVKNVAWIMLKYVTVSYMGYKTVKSKKKTLITKVVQRSKIATELAPVVENMMYEKGYDDVTIEMYISKIKQSKSINDLPDSIRNEFKFEQYIEQYELTDEKREEVLEYINSRADKFEELWNKDEEEWTPLEITEKDNFYCNNLCSHRNICTQLKRFNDTRQNDKGLDEDLF